MKYIKSFMLANVFILSFFSNTIFASNGEEATTSSNNQLMGTILIGGGVLIIVVAVIIILNRLRGDKADAPADSTNNNNEKKMNEDQSMSEEPKPELEKLNKVPEPADAPPVEELQKPGTAATNQAAAGPAEVNTPGETMPAQNIVNNQVTTPQKPANTVGDTDNLPKVPLSELSGGDQGAEKSYSLEDIQAGAGSDASTTNSQQSDTNPQQPNNKSS